MSCACVGLQMYGHVCCAGLTGAPRQLLPPLGRFSPALRPWLLPPACLQTYIHRSGRTGRAGSTGISLTLVDRKKECLIPYIQVGGWLGGWWLMSPEGGLAGAVVMCRCAGKRLLLLLPPHPPPHCYLPACRPRLA